jgi:ATP-dependent Clp protease ATP-binding subunit ClpC
VPSRVANDFARRIGDMYRRWAAQRRMQCEVLEESGGRRGRPYHLLLAVSGYAAHSILAHEEGLHVLEAPEGNGRGFRRVAARVRVCPQPEQPAANARALADQAHDVLAQPAPGTLAIARRYREEPSPLVRDNARGWRTGKLARVLEGNFDLLGESLVGV